MVEPFELAMVRGSGDLKILFGLLWHESVAIWNEEDSFLFRNMYIPSINKFVNLC
jgi:hypothetical protein